MQQANLWPWMTEPQSQMGGRFYEIKERSSFTQRRAETWQAVKDKEEEKKTKKMCSWRNWQALQEKTSQNSFYASQENGLTLSVTLSQPWKMLHNYVIH